MESTVGISPSNYFAALSGVARCCWVVAVTMVIVLSETNALANTITIETAVAENLSGPVTENGFTYSTLNGGLLINQFGNPGKDAEGAGGGLGGGVLKIISATGDDFSFDALDFAAFIFRVSDPKHSKPKGCSPERLSGWINTRLPTPICSSMLRLPRDTQTGPPKPHRYWPAKRFPNSTSL
jgi:hypothetical protein